MLSELEGAILIEIDLRGRKTAFQVRKAFQMSPTRDWSGSAGAVYPAIRRLSDQGLIEKTAQDDARGTQRLSVTIDGKAALDAWASDTELATAISADPFRTRVDYLLTLPEARRANAIIALHDALMQSHRQIETFLETDPKTKIEANHLALNLLQARIDWIEAVTDAC